MSRLFFLSGKPTNNNSNQNHANQNDQGDIYDFHYINNVHIFRGLISHHVYNGNFDLVRGHYVIKEAYWNIYACRSYFGDYYDAPRANVW